MGLSRIPGEYANYLWYRTSDPVEETENEPLTVETVPDDEQNGSEYPSGAPSAPSRSRSRSQGPKRRPKA
jgi:hypothetical protein